MIAHHIPPTFPPPPNSAAAAGPPPLCRQFGAGAWWQRSIVQRSRFFKTFLGRFRPTQVCFLTLQCIVWDMFWVCVCWFNVAECDHNVHFTLSFLSSGWYEWTVLQKAVEECNNVECTFVNIAMHCIPQNDAFGSHPASSKMMQLQRKTSGWEMHRRASQGQFGRKSLKDIPSKTRLHVWSRSESSVVNVKGEKALGEKTGQSQNILIWDIWPAIYFVRDNILPWDMVHWQFLFYLLAEQHLCKVILRTVCARPTTPWFIYPLPGCS